MDNNNNTKTSNLGGGGKKFLLVNKQQKPVTFRLWGDETSGNVDEGIGFPYTDYTINPGEDIIEKCPNIVGGYALTYGAKYLVNTPLPEDDDDENEKKEYFRGYYKTTLENDIVDSNFGIINDDKYKTLLVQPITIENRHNYRPNDNIIIEGWVDLCGIYMFPEYIKVYCPEEYIDKANYVFAVITTIEITPILNNIRTLMTVPIGVTGINEPIFTNYNIKMPYYEGYSKEISIHLKVVMSDYFSQLQNIYIPMTYDEFGKYLSIYINDEENKIIRLSNWTNNSNSYFKWSTKHIDDGNGNTKDIEYRSGVNYTGNFVFTDRTVPSTDFIQNPDDIN